MALGFNHTVTGQIVCKPPENHEFGPCYLRVCRRAATEYREKNNGGLRNDAGANCKGTTYRIHDFWGGIGKISTTIRVSDSFIGDAPLPPRYKCSEYKTYTWMYM